jgi:hypothetical protein
MSAAARRRATLDILEAVGLTSSQLQVVARRPHGHGQRSRADSDFEGFFGGKRILDGASPSVVPLRHLR